MKKRLVILLAGLLTVLSMGFGLAQFSDVPAGHWAKEAVEALAARGIIGGFPDGTFRGNETLTRYQAALIIYRLLQQIEAELKGQGQSPTLAAMDEETLNALKNAVQELASELAALGVRVSALEDNAASKDDIARLEALIEELKAQPAPEPGMDQAALQDLADRVEAASIAADTALAQAQQVSEQLEALSQSVEDLKDQLADLASRVEAAVAAAQEALDQVQQQMADAAALQSQVEANADAIQALNELAVQLNQDILALQDRMTALEKLVSGGAELPDLEQFATKEDVAAVQEFAAALRSDLVGLADQLQQLSNRLQELAQLSQDVEGVKGALTDLADRVEAASIAADTALAQAQQLAEQLDALAQDVEGVKGDVAALQTQVEANAGAIQALNELAVLLNQDVLTLQDRVTALEKLVSGGAELPDLGQFATKADLEELATKEDVAAVQEFAAALRSDLVGLSEKVTKLEGQVAELSRVQYSIKGSLSVTYGTVDTDTGVDFDIDRLFPGNAFSTGVFGNATSNVQKEDSNQGNISLGRAFLTFGVKNAAPAASGVAVSEASVGLRVNAFTAPFTTTPPVHLNSASVKGSVDGQPFSLAYSRNNSAFKFNDYLFANDKDDDVVNPRQGVVATFSGTKFPLTPEVTLVTGVAGTAAGNPDPNPALRAGNYFGIRTAFKPLSGLSLALNYATNPGNRSAIGADGGLEVGPLKLSGLWVSSQAPGSPVADFFNNTLSDWAYYVQAEAGLGSLSLSANYHAVDPQYADGQAGMSENEDTNYYGGVKAGAPYGANTRGLEVKANTALGPLSLKGYAWSEGNYNLAPGSVSSAYGVAATLGSFAGFSLTGFYNAALTGGNAYFRGTSADAVAPGTYYLYTNPNQEYSSSWGAKLAHDGKAQGALIPTLNLTLQYTRFYLSGYNDFQAYANLSQPLKLAFLSLNPGFRYHVFTGASAKTGDYTTLKFGVQAGTDPILLGLSLDGAVSYRQTQYAGNSTAVGGVTSATTTYELYWRAGAKLSDFLVPKLNFSVAYAYYEGDQLAGGGLPVVGSGNQAFNFARDRVYRSPDPIAAPWLATPGTQAGKLNGFYLEAKYYNLTVAYGEFILDNLTNTATNFGRGFVISYNVDF